MKTVTLTLIFVILCSAISKHLRHHHHDHLSSKHSFVQTKDRLASQAGSLYEMLLDEGETAVPSSLAEEGVADESQENLNQVNNLVEESNQLGETENSNSQENLAENENIPQPEALTEESSSAESENNSENEGENAQASNEGN